MEDGFPLREDRMHGFPLREDRMLRLQQKYTSMDHFDISFKFEIYIRGEQIYAFVRRKKIIKLVGGKKKKKKKKIIIRT